MKVMVTGSAGFIGQRVIRALEAAGHQYVRVDRRDSVAPVDLMMISRRHFHDVGAVVHLAALADVSGNWNHDGTRERLYEDNIFATIALLESMPAVPIIFASTAAVYGDAPGRPSYETDVPQPGSPYAATKLAGEALVQAYAARRGTPWYALRLVAAVGAGYTHGHIKDFVAQAKGGHVRPRTAGAVRRSAVHVDDVADTIAALVQPGHPSGIYNVSSSEAWSWRDTVEIMKGGGRFTVHDDATTERGWVGDPLVSVSGDKAGGIHECARPIADGVREALAALGWGS